MKHIFLLIMIFLGSFMTCSAQTEKLDQLFKDFEKNGGVTSIDIKKPMFKLLNNIDVDDEYLGTIKPILRQVDGLRVLIIPKATFPANLKSENLVNIKLNEEKTDKVNKALKNLNFNELMSLNNEGTSMKFLGETGKDDLLENLIFNIDSNEENIIFILNGKMKMEDVNKMINSTETKSNISVSSANNNFVQENTSYLNGESRNVGEFSGIQASMGVIVNFKQETPTQVKVIADADKLQYVMTKVENGVLKVFIDNKGQKNLKFKNISVNVSSPKMNQIKTSSGAIFNSISSINEENLIVDVSSGSVVNGSFNISTNVNLELSSGAVINSQINSENIMIKGSSGSAANISGNAKMGSMDVSSGAVCNAEDFKVNILNVESTSGAIISGHAVDSLKAKASSGGIINYKGNPKIESHINKITGGSLTSIR